MRIPITQAVTENCEKIAENCGDIAALQAKTLQTAIQPRLVYSISDTPRGFTWERWGPRAGTQTGDLAGFDAQWGGPEVDGIPTHTDGAPTTSGIENDTRYSPSDSGQDEHRLCYWVYNDRAVAIEIQDIDTRAESVRVYAGCDCPSSLVHERYQIGGGTPYNSQGDKFLTLPPGGLVKMTVLIHDPGADFSGFRPVANEVDSADTFLPTTYQARPTVECRIEDDDACNRYELADGESWHPIEINCLDCGGGGEGPAGADGAQGPIGPVGPAGADGADAQVTVCNGPFVDESPRTGWWAGWTPVTTANTGTVEIIPWATFARLDAPDCVTDVKVDIDVGNHYLRQRRNRIYLWIDLRMLVNGGVVLTRTFDKYFYRDELNDTNPDVIPGIGIDIFPLGGSTMVRNAIPAGATVEIQRAVRWSVNATQSSGYARYIGGLRSKASAVFVPRQLVEPA